MCSISCIWALRNQNVVEWGGWEMFNSLNASESSRRRAPWRDEEEGWNCQARRCFYAPFVVCACVWERFLLFVEMLSVFTQKSKIWTGKKLSSFFGKCCFSRHHHCRRRRRRRRCRCHLVIASDEYTTMARFFWFCCSQKNYYNKINWLKGFLCCALASVGF